MGENTSKWNNWQRINYQNIQAAHTTQYQKNKQPNQKVGKRPIQTYFSEEDIQMANKHVKRCSTLLIIKEISLKKTYRWLTNTWKDAQHCLLLKKYKSKLQWAITSHRSEWASSKSLQTINAGEGVEKRELSCMRWDCKLIQSLWKTVWRFLKKLWIKVTKWPRNPNSGHIPWGNQNWKGHMYPIVHFSTIYNS